MSAHRFRAGDVVRLKGRHMIRHPLVVAAVGDDMVWFNGSSTYPDKLVLLQAATDEAHRNTLEWFAGQEREPEGRGFDRHIHHARANLAALGGGEGATCG